MKTIDLHVKTQDLHNNTSQKHQLRWAWDFVVHFITGDYDVIGQEAGGSLPAAEQLTSSLVFRRQLE